MEFFYFGKRSCCRHCCCCLLLLCPALLLRLVPPSLHCAAKAVIITLIVFFCFWTYPSAAPDRHMQSCMQQAYVFLYVSMYVLNWRPSHRGTSDLCQRNVKGIRSQGLDVHFFTFKQSTFMAGDLLLRKRRQKKKKKEENETCH